MTRAGRELHNPLPQNEAVLRRGVKALHLSYLGDAELEALQRRAEWNLTSNLSR